MSSPPLKPALSVRGRQVELRPPGPCTVREVGPWWAARQCVRSNSRSPPGRHSSRCLSPSWPHLGMDPADATGDPAAGDTAGDPTGSPAGSEGRSAGESVSLMGCVWQGQGWGTCEECGRVCWLSVAGLHVCAQVGTRVEGIPVPQPSVGLDCMGPPGSGHEHAGACQHSLPGLRAAGRRLCVPWEGRHQLPRYKLRGLIVPRGAAFWPLARWLPEDCVTGPTLQGRTEPHMEVGEAGMCGDWWEGWVFL